MVVTNAYMSSLKYMIWIQKAYKRDILLRRQNSTGRKSRNVVMFLVKYKLRAWLIDLVMKKEEYFFTITNQECHLNHKLCKVLKTNSNNSKKVSNPSRTSIEEAPWLFHLMENKFCTKVEVVKMPHLLGITPIIIKVLKGIL